MMIHSDWHIHSENSYDASNPITYGSDSYHNYEDLRPTVESYLSAAGFQDGDFSDLSAKDF